MNDPFDEDYFLCGQETGKSLYTDYRWLPDLTIPMVLTIIRHLGIRYKDTILDFGCARGYVVKAFRELGYGAYGHDTSEWAVKNADPAVSHYLTQNPDIALATSYDWVIAKDVLEHIEQVERTINALKKVARKGVFVIVPLAHGDRYDVPEYEQDITHVIRRPLSWWVSNFLQQGWSVEACYRIKGIKDNYKDWPTGNGFLTCRRPLD